MKTYARLWSYLDHFFLELEMFQTEVVEKIKIHNLCPIIFCLNHTFHETMRKVMVEPGCPQKTTWRMRIACWVPRATNTRQGLVMLTAFPQQHWLHESSSTLRNTFIASVVLPETINTSVKI